MAVHSLVPLSALENFKDCSPEYYRPEYLELSHNLRYWPTTRIKNEAYVTDGEHGSPEWEPTSGISYITADYIKANYIEDVSMRSISTRQDFRNIRCRVQPNDVLVYSVGAYAGFVARAEPHLFPANIPRSVAIIRLSSSSSIKPGFLSIFLNSRFGRFQTNRLRAGNSQPVLALEKIRQLEIPILPEDFQNKLEHIYEAAYQYRLTCKKSLAQAQQLIELGLGLEKVNFQKPVGYTAKFSDMEQSRRIDPEHYFPEFKAFVKGLPVGVSLEPLSRYLRFCQRGTQPIYTKSGLPVINSKHVQPNRVLLEDNRFALPNPLPDFQIRQGDILMNGTGRGTLGRVAPYLMDGLAVPDNHVTILRSDTLDPAFVSFYLNSIAGQMQVDMHQRGSSGQLELYPFDIRKFLIWPAPESIQKEIHQLHEKAALSEQESKRLLQQAKNSVEQLIEEAAKS